MDLEVAGKKFLIGGGSKGLGGAIAETLAAEGAQVLLMARSEDELAQAASSMGGAASWVAVDIADPDAVQIVATAVDDKLGGLDGILINAGGPPAGEVLALSDEQWLGSYQTLIGGPIRLLRELTTRMANGGAILFVTSVSVRQPVEGLDTSNVLRPGVAALAKVLARELAPAIRVNSLAPGRFDTERVRTLDEVWARAKGTTVEEEKSATTSQIPLGRYGDPAEFGRVGAFLLSPAASFVSGISVQVDGAMTTAIP